MTRTRREVFLSLTALAIVTGLSVSALNMEIRAERTAMPDGSTVAFAGATSGNGPGITYGRPWQMLLYPVVPPQLRSAFMTDATQLAPDQWPGSLTLWFHHSNYFPHADRIGARRVLTLDSHGCPFEWGYWTSGAAHKGGFAMACRVRAFSRRERALEHRYLVRTGPEEWMQAMNVGTGNPGEGAYPKWKAVPLPQTKRVGELAVTLAELRAPSPLPPPEQPLRDDRDVMSELSLRLDGSETLRRRWKPVEVTLEDATGNRHQRETMEVAQLDDFQPATKWKTGSRPGEWHVRLPGGLCAREDAWKVRVEWSQHAAPAGTPDEVWKVPVLSIPPLHTHHQFSVGPGLEGLIETSGEVKGKRVFVVAFRRVPEGRRFVVEAIDDRGQRLTSIDTGMDDPSILQTRTRGFVFRAPLDCRRIDLRVKVYNTRIVEFMAKPGGR